LAEDSDANRPFSNRRAIWQLGPMDSFEQSL
jgi:hypothetical protein